MKDTYTEDALASLPVNAMARVIGSYIVLQSSTVDKMYKMLQRASVSF